MVLIDCELYDIMNRSFNNVVIYQSQREKNEIKIILVPDANVFFSTLNFIERKKSTHNRIFVPRTN